MRSEGPDAVQGVPAGGPTGSGADCGGARGASGVRCPRVRGGVGADVKKIMTLALLPAPALAAPARAEVTATSAPE